MIRSIKRNIARNRMKDMGLDHISHRMHIRRDDTLVKNCVLALQKTRNGRRRLLSIYAKNPPIWRRVVEGDLAKDAEKYFVKASIARGGNPYYGKANKKGNRKLRKLSAQEV